MVSSMTSIVRETTAGVQKTQSPQGKRILILDEEQGGNFAADQSELTDFDSVRRMLDAPRRWHSGFPAVPTFRMRLPWQSPHPQHPAHPEPVERPSVIPTTARSSRACRGTWQSRPRAALLQVLVGNPRHRAHLGAKLRAVYVLQPASARLRNLIQLEPPSA